MESTGGARLRVVVYGPRDAQPVVLVHGWTCDAQVWLPQVRALAETNRVITYDQRGHGGSSFGAQPPRVEALGDDLSAVLAATLREDERAVIAGHSMGGMSIMSWAKHHPEEVAARASAVVLTATGAHALVERLAVPFLGGGPLGVPTAESIVFLLGLPVSFDWKVLRRSGLVRFLVRNLVLSPEADDAATDLTAAMAFDCPTQTRVACLKAMVTDLDVLEGLRNLVVPTVVVAGAQDRLIPPVHSYEMADVLAETGWLDRLVVYPGSGHMVALEETEQYNAVLREVVERASRSTAGSSR